jgi:23S rRNA pseudouridine955/2504/2580 synthase
MLYNSFAVLTATTLQAARRGAVMREITITANDAGRRLDRFLRKYLSNASLSEIYRIIRKDVKVGGRRRQESYMLSEGDVLTLYMPDDVLDRLTGSGRSELPR